MENNKFDDEAFIDNHPEKVYPDLENVTLRKAKQHQFRFKNTKDEYKYKK